MWRRLTIPLVLAAAVLTGCDAAEVPAVPSPSISAPAQTAQPASPSPTPSAQEPVPSTATPIPTPTPTNTATPTPVQPPTAVPEGPVVGEPTDSAAEFQHCSQQFLTMVTDPSITSHVTPVVIEAWQLAFQNAAAMAGDGDDASANEACQALIQEMSAVLG